jgi:hypothetical protein
LNGLAVNPMTIDLVGSVRVRRHSHHRYRSAPADGFSNGPGAYRVPVPILVASIAGTRNNPTSIHGLWKTPYSAASDPIDAASEIFWNSLRISL